MIAFTMPLLVGGREPRISWMLTMIAFTMPLLVRGGSQGKAGCSP